MNTIRARRSVPRFVPGMLVAALLVCVGCDNKVQKVVGIGVGQDPHKFLAADEMYAIAEERSYDAQAGELIKMVTDGIEQTGSARAADGNYWWKCLAGLNPYRKTRELQAIVPSWANRLAAQARQPREPVSASARQAVSEGNSLYRQGKFGPASAKYVEALTDSPHYIDARNNLALAQLHKGYDLIAQLQLEVLQILHADHCPSQINLTVVYERLGQRGKARDVAYKLIEQRKDVPAAVHNAAWFMSLEGRYAEARDLMQPLADINGLPARGDRSLDDPDKGLFELVAMKSGERKTVGNGFWGNGIAGACGGRSAWWARVLALIIFGFLSLFLIGGAAGTNNKSSAFWLSLLLTGLWYVLFWGVPVGGTWVLCIMFVLVSGGMSAGSARK